MSDKEKLTEQLAEGVNSAAQAVRALLQGALNAREEAMLEDIATALASIGDDARPDHCSGLICELTSAACCAHGNKSCAEAGDGSKCDECYAGAY